MRPLVVANTPRPGTPCPRTDNNALWPSGDPYLATEESPLHSESKISWLASSEAEISRAREALSRLSTEGVLDELGFLVLLGAFSDRLYPAVNTIMTRARYLVFVPAIYRHLESIGARSPQRVEREARAIQNRLSEALAAGERKVEGVIGKMAGERIARPASNVYWSALYSLRIARRQTSESAYLRSIAAGTERSDTFVDDDRVRHLAEDASLWDSTFPVRDAAPKDGVYDHGTTFALTPAEARELKRRYSLVRPDGECSLLDHLLSLPRVRAEVPHPWDVENAPESLARVLKHARLLSLMARGATLQFHSLLFRKRTLEDTGTRPAFVEWWDAAADDLAHWDLGELGSLPCVLRAQRGSPLTFISEWVTAITRSRSARSAYDDGRAREILAEREARVRGNKARLRSDFHLTSWTPPKAYHPGDRYALFYRHHRGTVFALDILDGLKGTAR